VVVDFCVDLFNSIFVYILRRRSSVVEIGSGSGSGSGSGGRVVVAVGW
jgi:hypothetical protein